MTNYFTQCQSSFKKHGQSVITPNLKNNPPSAPTVSSPVNSEFSPLRLDNPHACKSNKGLGFNHLNIRGLCEQEKLDH